MDEDLLDLVRTSVRQALESSPDDIGAALAEFGWADLAATDEAFAFTALFEAQGGLGADTDALDVVTAATVGVDGPVRIVWPLADAAGGDGAAGPRRVIGIALRPLGDGPVFARLGGHLAALDVEESDETPAGGMAAGMGWVRVRLTATAGAPVAPWAEVARRVQLAIGSELVGISQRILDVAVEQVSVRKQFGQPIAANQAVRHKLAEAYAETVGGRGVVARAWEDGRPEAAEWARTVAAASVDAVGKHAMQVCGAIGLSGEHPVPRLVRRGFALGALVPPSGPAAIGRRFLDAEALEPLGAF